MKLAEWQKAEKIFHSSYNPEEKYKFADLARLVGPGWADLLSETCAKLFALGWTGGVEQVKEKFGTLRLYFTNDCTYPDIAYDVVDQAEWRSGNICEECGNYGKLRGQGWLYTACDECHAAREAKRQKSPQPPTL